MRKKILIAEQSDTTRGIAENVLRQHGYEVISVAAGDKALEVLELSRPNLILMDYAMTTKGKRSLFERVQQDQLTSSIPFILIADEDDKSISYPDEVVVTRPLDPKDLVMKVSALTGGARTQAKQAGSSPLEGDSMEDQLLDAALGLDQIDVTDSEIMDNSTVIQKKEKKGVEKMIGMEHEHDLEPDEDSQGNKVESLQIDDESTEISHRKGAPKNPNKTGKLEILSDHEQFGLGNEALLETASEYTKHDYEWFITEMKKDAVPPGGKPGQPKSAGADVKAQKPSAHFDTVTSPDKKTSDSGKIKGEKGSAGVERYIEDFKKEVEKITDITPPSAVKTAKATAPKAAAAAAKPPADLERITIDQVEMFTRQFISELAEKVAEKIATKIDPQKLLSLIKNEIVSRSQKQ